MNCVIQTDHESWALMNWREGILRRTRMFGVTLLLGGTVVAAITRAHETQNQGMREALPLPQVKFATLLDFPFQGSQEFQQAMPQQQAKQESTGTIAGTIVDPSGAPIPGAIVQLGHPDQTPMVQTTTDEYGQFDFLNLVPGEYRLTILAESFESQRPSATVHAGEHYVEPSITLSLAAHATRITVTSKTEEEIAEQQIKVQETQRVLGLVPNFYVSYVSDAVPLRFKQKMNLAWKTSVDPVTIGSVALAAGIEQERNWYRAYGGGVEGYGKRFGAAYANVAASTFLGKAIMPALLKQDPRYFYSGTGNWRLRLWYALSRSVITKGDNGSWQPNYSNFLGNLAASGIASAYRPDKNRNVGFVFQAAGIKVAETAVANVFQEFISPKLTPSLSKRCPSTKC